MQGNRERERERAVAVEIQMNELQLQLVDERKKSHWQEGDVESDGQW